MRGLISGIGWLVCAVALAAATPAAAQWRPTSPIGGPIAGRMYAAPPPRSATLAPRASTTTTPLSRTATLTPLGRGAVPALARAPGAARRGIVIPGQPTPSKAAIIRPGVGQPDPNRRIIRPGESRAPDPNRRIIMPGEAAPTGRGPRGPLIVPVNGASLDAMARALRSVGEHRLAAQLCRQSGGCTSNGRSPRELSAAIRRGAVDIRLPIDTRRLIYSANNRGGVMRNGEERMPRLTRVHGRNDPVAQRAFDKAGVILAFYRNVLGRMSFDGQNGAVRFVVHYGENDDNAAWNSPHESTFRHPIATFGSGNETSRAQVEGDIPYHEFTHGVVDHEANFVYHGEPGALHEHFADALGETAQQWERGESVRESSWTIGEGTYRLGAQEGALRSFANPALYGQPGHVREMAMVDRRSDHGGVHTLNGVPNRAFYGAAMRLGGHSWEHVGPIWYSALREHLGRYATIRDAAAATVRSAGELFGPRSREARAVRAGWADVGIRVPLGRGGLPPRGALPYGATPPPGFSEDHPPDDSTEDHRPRR